MESARQEQHDDWEDPYDAMTEKKTLVDWVDHNNSCSKRISTPSPTTPMICTASSKGAVFNPVTLKSDQFQISPVASQEI